jgi:hypothetical protein
LVGGELGELQAQLCGGGWVTLQDGRCGIWVHRASDGLDGLGDRGCGFICCGPEQPAGDFRRNSKSEGDKGIH